jgi:hypothetical protein
MDIRETNTQAMLDQFASLRAHLDELQSRIPKLPATDLNSQKMTDLADALFCMQLSLTFYVEANTALQAGAWFAAATIAASALEAVLLGKCLLAQDEIRALPKWKSFKKSYTTNFGAFARSLDLGKLLEIAKELSWFPPMGLPKQFQKTMSDYLIRRRWLNS